MSEVTEVMAQHETGPDGWPIANLSDVPTEMVANHDSVREIARQMSAWVDNARKGNVRSGMFDRAAYTPPDNPYDEMKAARHAVAHDDVVSGVGDITEAFAFKGIKWESRERDEADVFNQMNRDIDLDSAIRRMWHEEYACSQFVVASDWGWREYKIRGRTSLGNRRKKAIRAYVPTSLHVIDSTKVVPIAHTPVGSERLAWHTGNHLIDRWRRARRGEEPDPILARYHVGPYVPDEGERQELEALGVRNQLLEFDPRHVWRHTATKPDYERFAKIRLKSLFSILDLKQQLMHADRSSLVGAANYILLIRKGTKEQPARQEEIDHLKENYSFIARLPVIISDHRLEIEIVAPRIDLTLQEEKYATLDLRILARLLGTLTIGGSGQRNETNVTLSRAVARGMENRRHMIARTLERHIARAVVDHPYNAGVFSDVPSLVYIPRNISLDIDAELIKGVVGLRDKREISRETILEYFGFDQEIEAQRREVEDEHYDDIFQSHVPFDSPDGETPGAAGRRGGRPTEPEQEEE